MNPLISGLKVSVWSTEDCGLVVHERTPRQGRETGRRRTRASGCRVSFSDLRGKKDSDTPPHFLVPEAIRDQPPRDGQEGGSRKAREKAEDQVDSDVIGWVLDLPLDYWRTIWLTKRHGEVEHWT